MYAGSRLMGNKEKSGSMKPWSLSLLVGFSISFLLALPVLIFDEHGLWLDVYRVIYEHIPMPVAILSRRVFPSVVDEVFFCKPLILGGLLTWGLFFWSMIYGYLCRRKPATEGPRSSALKSDRSQSSRAWLPIISTAILILSMGFAAAGIALTAYRVWSGGGPDFSGLTNPIEIIAGAAVIGIPIILIVTFSRIFPTGKIGNSMTLLVAVLYAAASGCMLVGVIFTSHDPYGLKGGEYLYDLVFLGFMLFFLWMVLYGASTVIESWWRRGLPNKRRETHG
jgi:hypothetical protein